MNLTGEKVPQTGLTDEQFFQVIYDKDNQNNMTDIKDFAFGDKEPFVLSIDNKESSFNRPIKIQPWMKPIKIVYPSEWDISINENDNPDSKYTIGLTQTLTLLTVIVIKKKYIEGYDLKNSLYASLFCRSKFGGVKWIDIDFDLENLEPFHKFIKSIEDKGMVKVHTDITKLMDNRCYITAEGDYAVDGDNQVGVMSIDTYEGNITVNL